MAQADFEIKTPGGYLIKVKTEQGIYTVSRSGRSDGRGDQRILHAIFIGAGFETGLMENTIALPVKKNRVHVPYKLSGREHHLSLPIATDLDQVPVKISSRESLKDLPTDAFPASQFVVLDESIPRIDMINVKVRHPAVNILVVHPDEGQREEHRTVRATDVVKEGRGGDLVQNPVFMARVHLRNLDLERVRRLFLDFDMSSDEIQFVRTFLQVMVRNERQTKELEVAQKDLVRLDEVYRVVATLKSGIPGEFDKELDKMHPEVAKDIQPLIARLRTRAKSKEQQIYYWECEVRLGKIAQK